MRFSLAVAALAAGAAAAVAPQEEEQTVTVTEYTTYCPSATMSQLPQYTTSAGHSYSISRPLITSTVTHCEKWYVPLIIPPSTYSVLTKEQQLYPRPLLHHSRSGPRQHPRGQAQP